MRSRREWVLGGVLLLLLVGNVVVTQRFTAENPGMNDFLSRWEAARTFWQDGASPYSDEATANIQEIIYGRPATADEDQGLFAYPMYTVFYVAPVVSLPYSWASAVWMVLLEVCLIAGLYLLLATIRWRPTVMMQGVLVGFTLLNYYAFRGLLLGQLSHIVFMFTALALWGLSRERDALAGVALALTTIKPQMGFLLVPFLLLWGLREGRWRFVTGFTATFAVLMGASFALQPDWFGAWLEQVALYPTYTRDGSPVWILFEFYLGLPPIVGYIVRAILVGWMLWAWYQVLIQRDQTKLLWTVALTLLITHTAGPRTATPHFTVFMLMLLVMMQRFARRRQLMWNALLLTGLFLVPWVHFITTIIPPNLENLSVFLPLVGLVMLTLWLSRRYWWGMSPVLTTETS